MTCPICGQDHGRLVQQFNEPFDAEIQAILTEESPSWKPEWGACTRCIDLAQSEQWQNHIYGKQSFSFPSIHNEIFPIPTRLFADPHYTGKGVTICFIDSGFYPHPDLCLPENRILKMVDIQNIEESNNESPSMPSAHQWHGTMTSVVGAGNGRLSEGYYRSLAPDAKVVLVKVMDSQGRITDESIVAALQWVLTHHHHYGIRIVNLSVTADHALPFRQSPVDVAVEKLVEAGITVVTAAGNTQGSQLKAPANSPHAITVGGLNDHNTLNPIYHSLYHSTFGRTADKTYKPELIAPSIWLPAPLLPGSAEQLEAEALWTLKTAKKPFKKAIAANVLPYTQLPVSLLEKNLENLDHHVDQRIDQAKYLSPHYQHADGTSFAAPIVCSVIAQMLEANPALGPYDIRDLLLTTARQLPRLPRERQGFGVIHPLSAVHFSHNGHHPSSLGVNPIIDYKKKQVHYHFHHESTTSVALIGSFDGWRSPGKPMRQTNDHHWVLATPLPPAGTYAYKFLIPENIWLTDARNLYRSPDGLGGFNSLLIVEDSTTVKDL